MGWKGASMSIPREGGCCKSIVPSVSPAVGNVSALVMSAFSLSCQILVTFEAHNTSIIYIDMSKMTLT